MEIAVLGFGKVAKKIVARIKEFPEFGREGAVTLYAIHTKRHSLSYGPNVVVETPDSYDDGLRTYKDGYQSIENYYTSVTNYEDWLIGELKKGCIDTVIDCMSQNEDSNRTLERFLESAPEGTKFYLSNKNMENSYKDKVNKIATQRRISICFKASNMLSPETAADLISEELRVDLNGGSPWSKVIRSKQFWLEAEERYQAAKEKMHALRLMKRTVDIEERLDILGPNPRSDLNRISNAINEIDLESIQRFIVQGEGDFKRSEWYDSDRKCLVIEHEMIEWFFGPFGLEDAATQAFLEPTLRTTSGRYYKYDSPESYVELHVEAPSCGYAVEYVITQGAEWGLALEGSPDQVIPAGQAIAYKSKEVSRDFLGTAKYPVELLVVHFTKTIDDTPPKCNCYER